MKKQSTSIIHTITVAIITLVVFGYAVSFAQVGWTGPISEAPDDNTPAPLNTGEEDQEKEGPLIINSGLLSSLGLAVFGNLEVTNGGIVADEDICTNVNGDPICLSSLLPPTPPPQFQCGEIAFNSLKFQGNPNPDCSVNADHCVDRVNRVTGFRQVPMPSSCSTPSGCYIKQEIYGSGNALVATRYVKFIQESVAQANGTFKWWSEYARSGNLSNGDGTTSNVMAPLKRTLSNGTDQWILLRDDRASVANIGENRGTTYTERSPSMLSAYDTRTDRAMIVRFCAETEPIDEIGE